MNIKPQTTQLTLDFEPGLTDRYRNLRECIAASIYRHGLSRAAIDLNESPGNLTNQLSDDSPRKFGVDEFEEWMAKSKDYEAVYYLVEKFLHRPDVQQNAALAQLPSLMAQLQAVMKAAGVAP